MAVFLLKIIFLALTTLSNLASLLIFKSTARLLVLMIRAFKIPREAMKGGLVQAVAFIKACLEYLVKVLMKVISFLASILFEFVKERALEVAVAGGAAGGGVVEKMRGSINGLLKEVPEVLKGFGEKVGKILVDLWRNYKEAVGYFMQNA